MIDNWHFSTQLLNKDESREQRSTFGYRDGWLINFKTAKKTGKRGRGGEKGEREKRGRERGREEEKRGMEGVGNSKGGAIEGRGRDRRARERTDEASKPVHHKMVNFARIFTN